MACIDRTHTHRSYLDTTCSLVDRLHSVDRGLEKAPWLILYRKRYNICILSQSCDLVPMVPQQGSSSIQLQHRSAL